jgi:hypothetical protein
VWLQWVEIYKGLEMDILDGPPFGQSSTEIWAGVKKQLDERIRNSRRNGSDNIAV